MKKLISVILAFIMLLSVMTATSAAKEASSGTQIYKTVMPLPEEECTCICHADDLYNGTEDFYTTGNLNAIVKMVLYRVELLFWRLFGINQFCECGKRHY